MKLVTFERGGRESIGAVAEQGIVPFGALVPELDVPMLELVRRSPALLPVARSVVAGPVPDRAIVPLSEARLLAPIPRPPSMRDGYAFRQHVETARRNRGLPMIEEFDRFPVFYFTNHQAVIGPGELRVGRRRLERLDFELEVAAVVGREVRNPTLEEADDAIFGYAIMNDFSARALQMEEMKLNLGPAKGKDFATAIGPWLVTRDELADRLTPSAAGNVLHAGMTAEVNGVRVSRGDAADMHWTFAQILERAGDGVTLFPGDVIGSGTVGTGCFLELNGSKITHDQWLHPGDAISLSVEGLGTLTHRIVEDPRC
ncbi:MAG TPA: fumarylacetoacetate hydrolase family protein [Thermoanaerobaculia bacterium]|nr:fumarylacetoacetate hydrolase family protein [Thermoanaerobaculia bacterium]